MKKSILFVVVLLTAALVGGLTLVSQNQETRKSAAFAKTTLKLLPDETIEQGVDDTLSVQLWFETESGAKVDNVQSMVCFGDELSLDEEGVEVNTDAGFDSSPIVVVEDGCATIVVTSKKSSDELKESGKVFTMNFKAVDEGEGNITINKDKSSVTGDNPKSATDKTITITSVSGTDYKIEGQGVGGPVLNFKIASSKMVSEPKCLKELKVNLTVLGGGVTKVYTNVTATRDGTVFKAKKVLSGFSKVDDLAVFVKGPFHLQTKYGKNGQTEFYNKSGGEIDITSSDSSPTQDFSGYPMLVGDITGESGSQDGAIDGLDFSYLKKQMGKRVSDGESLVGDLNGDCVVNGLDSAGLIISLEDKIDQLY